jgi:hypothetical protein
VKGDRNLVQVAVFVAADEHDVVTLLMLQAETLAQNLSAKRSRGSERCASGEMEPVKWNQANKVHQSAFQSYSLFVSVLFEGNKPGTLVQQSVTNGSPCISHESATAAHRLCS